MRPLTAVVLILILCNILNAADTFMGINIGEPYETDRDFLFADAMRQARPWGSVANPLDMSAPVDANGWPTQDAGVAVIIGGNIAGTYHLSFTGRANVARINSPLTIQNAIYTAATNTTTADVVVDAAATQLLLSFTGTTGGVRNVKLMRPGYTTETFTTPIQTLIAPFSCIRFMPFTVTNYNQVINWADRTLPTHATQNRYFNGTSAGGAWEYAIELANLTGKDMWINIPDQASDDYILQLALLLNSTLAAERRIYIEYSNEVWNPMFPSAARNSAAAQAEVAAGNSPLNADGDTDSNHWAWRRIAKRIKETSDIFRSVFGDGAMMTRVRPVFAAWNSTPDTVRQGLEFIERTYGPPSNYFYALADGIYFNISNDLDARTDLTVDEIIAGLPEGITRTIGNSRIFTVWARYYNLKHVAYEGGQHLYGANNMTAKHDANHDLRMRDLVVSCVEQFFQIGGDYFLYFTASGHGNMGLTEDITIQDTPKIQAITQLLGAPQPIVTAGALVPAIVNAGSFDNQNATVPAGLASLPINSGMWFNYLIRVPATGTYTFSCSVSATAAGGRLQCLLNSTELATWDVPNTGAASVWADLPEISVALEAGLNVIRLNGVAGSFNCRMLTIGSMPALTSGPTVFPTVIVVGAPVVFTAAASAGATLSWDFGDGTLAATGASPTHTFAAAGPVTVSVTASDGVGHSLTATLLLTVQAAASENPAPIPPSSEPLPVPPPDDGPIANDPANPTNPDSPVGNAPAALPLTVNKLTGKMIFSAANKDSCTLHGVMPLSGASAFSGQVLILDVNGASVTFMLDKKGKSRVARNTFVLKATGAFVAKLTHGNWARHWMPESYDSVTDAADVRLELSIEINLDGIPYSASVPTFYSAHAAKSAAFKK